MLASLTLAETAASHPDGTVSVLRGGIRYLWTNGKLPAVLAGCLVVAVEGEVGDEGTHSFDLNCLDDDGTPVIPAIRGQFSSARGGTVSNLLVQFNTAFRKHGRFTFYLRVDNVQYATWTLTVAAKPEDLEK